VSRKRTAKIADAIFTGSGRAYVWLLCGGWLRPPKNGLCKSKKSKHPSTQTSINPNIHQPKHPSLQSMKTPLKFSISVALADEIENLSVFK